eukprot:Rmarinus@m.16715
MLIGVAGLPCCGKSRVVEYLVGNGFERIQSTDEVCDAWMKDYVLDKMYTYEECISLRKRPYFLLVYVSSPISKRWKWSQNRMDASDQEISTLESFIQRDDSLMFQSDGPRLHKVLEVADISLVNATEVDDFDDLLLNADLTSRERLRPSWDTYFMFLAYLASLRSNCMKRRVGAVVVKDNRVVATGYNGTPRNARNCNEGGCHRCNSYTPQGQALDECLCLHAEENAIIECGRARAEGGVLFCSLCPCLSCTKKIIQSGIRKVVYAADYAMDNKSACLFREVGVELCKFSFPPAYRPPMPPARAVQISTDSLSVTELDSSCVPQMTPHVPKKR